MKFLLQRACVLALRLFKTYCKSISDLHKHEDHWPLEITTLPSREDQHQLTLKHFRLGNTHISVTLFRFFLNWPWKKISKINYSSRIKGLTFGKEKKYYNWHTAFFERFKKQHITAYIRVRACIFIHACMCVCARVCIIKLFSSHPWDNHKEGIIMTTYVHPLAMFPTTDEVCNVFNMLLSSKEKQTLTHLTSSSLKNTAGWLG